MEAKGGQHMVKLGCVEVEEGQGRSVGFAKATTFVAWGDRRIQLGARLEVCSALCAFVQALMGG